MPKTRSGNGGDSSSSSSDEGNKDGGGDPTVRDANVDREIENERLRQEVLELREECRRSQVDTQMKKELRTTSIESEYYRIAHHNLTDAQQGDVYRKPSLKEPPMFDGTEVEDSPYALRRWMHDVFEFVTINFPNDEQAQVRYATRLLKGHARDGLDKWIDRMRIEGGTPTMVNWALELSKIIQPIDPALNAQKVWLRTRMSSTENAYNYYLKLEAIANCMNNAHSDSVIEEVSDKSLAARYKGTLTPRLAQKMEMQTRMLQRSGAPLPRHSWEWMKLALELEQDIKQEDAEAWEASRRARWANKGKKHAHVQTKGPSEKAPTMQVAHVMQPNGTVGRAQKKGKYKKNDTRICYACREPGHIATNCPKNGRAPGQIPDQPSEKGPGA